MGIAETPSLTFSAHLLEYYQCADLPAFALSGELGDSAGFFRFGPDVICYGQTVGKTYSTVNGHLVDIAEHARVVNDHVLVPFDITGVVDNLRYETYAHSNKRWVEKSWVRGLYYRLRPALPVAFRKHLQKLYLSGWDRIAFPSWPVDRTVDLLFEKLLVLAMQAMGVDRLPFVWFWPDGHSACAIMTHDVETAAGRDFCSHLMDIDDEFGVKASFQIVPEKRYTVPDSYLRTIRERGFEVNVQGLDHDGNLFQSHEGFLASAKKINAYAEQYNARGFRSPILYRNTNWLRELDFCYDMSVPNVARLEAQRGGCCTIMPYMLPGGMTELPVTIAEDYTLFHILKEYSTALWKQQIDLIRQGHGLMNFIIHPDYVIPRHARKVYTTLLDELAKLRSEGNIWVSLPGEVDTWWRQRREMKLVATGQGWMIEGAGSERACIAYASVDRDRLVYQID